MDFNRYAFVSLVKYMKPENTFGHCSIHFLAYVLNLQKASGVNVFIPLHEMVLALVCLSEPQPLQQAVFSYHFIGSHGKSQVYAQNPVKMLRAGEDSRF